MMKVIKNNPKSHVLTKDGKRYCNKCRKKEIDISSNSGCCNSCVNDMEVNHNVITDDNGDVIITVTKTALLDWLIDDCADMNIVINNMKKKFLDNKTFTFNDLLNTNMEIPFYITNMSEIMSMWGKEYSINEVFLINN